MNGLAGPHRLTPSQVQYLAFEGGGAKGIAFIGALAALEALGVRLRSGAHGTVRGVSGVSAGSMTAFLYAMRFTPAQMIEIQMADRAFTRFFQAPEPNIVRAVTPDGYARHRMVRWVGGRRQPMEVFDDAVKARMRALEAFPFSPDAGALKRMVADELRAQARAGIRRAVPATSGLAPLVDKVTASKQAFFDYCYSLLFDLGLFSGTEVRSFLKEQLVRFLGSVGGIAPAMRGRELDRISMAQFAGTNVSTGRSVYFRAASNAAGALDTPDFPVLDAVAISSAYPLAFKPYVVFVRRGVDNGYWLDGGVQNNLPLHAFDSGPVAPLDPGMLGIRLEESAEPIAAFKEDLANYVSVSVLGFLSTFLGGLLASAMYATEGGQIRTPQEEAQTVAIRIPGEVLSTLAFAPTKRNAGAAILIAFDAVADYFVPGFDAGRPPADNATSQESDLRDARRTLATMLPK